MQIIISLLGKVIFNSTLPSIVYHFFILLTVDYRFALIVPIKNMSCGLFPKIPKYSGSRVDASPILSNVLVSQIFC